MLRTPVLEKAPSGRALRPSQRVTPSPDATAQPVPAIASGPASRPYFLALGGLLIVQVLVAGWVAGHSFFFADDFFYGSILAVDSLTKDMLVRSWFGHLVPGFIALDWAFYRVFGANWTAATLVIIAVQLWTTVALVRLLTALRGRAWTNLVAGTTVALSLALTTQSLWWGAVLTNVVPLAASISALGCFVRWVRRARLSHLLAMALMFGVAVAFYEKSVLTAAYIGLLSLLVLDAGLPWRERARTTLERWPAWLLLGLIAGADLAVYLTGDYLVEAGPSPSPRELVAFLGKSFTEGLVPSLFGFLPSSLTGGTGLAVVLLTNVVVLGFAGWTSLHSRRALGAWLFFAAGFVLNQAVLGRGRLSLLGVDMGTLLRYQLENVVLFSVAVAVALPVLLRGLQRPGPAARRRRWTAIAVASSTLACLALPWWQGVRSEISVSAGTATRSFVENLRTSYSAQQARTPELGFLAGETVPGWVVYTQMAPFNRLDRVFPQLLPAAPFTSGAEQILTVSDDGSVVPASFIASVEVPIAAECLTGSGEQATRTVQLPTALPEGEWFLRLGYRSHQGGTVTVTVDNDRPGTDLRMATETHPVDVGSTQLLAVAGSVAVSKVTLVYAGTGRLCLNSLQLGTFQPA